MRHHRQASSIASAPASADVPVLNGGRQRAAEQSSAFREFDLLCPTERETREALHDFSNGLGAVVWDLLIATAAARHHHARQTRLVTSTATSSHWRAIGQRVFPALSPGRGGSAGCAMRCCNASLALAAGDHCRRRVCWFHRRRRWSAGHWNRR